MLWSNRLCWNRGLVMMTCCFREIYGLSNISVLQKYYQLHFCYCGQRPSLLGTPALRPSVRPVHVPIEREG